MGRSRKNKKIKLYLLIILGLTIGFALVSTTLYVNGVITFNPRTYDIHWNPNTIEVTSGSRPASTPAHITDVENKNIGFAVELEFPGDYYEFTVDAKNYGDVDGAINAITFNYYEDGSSTPTTLPSYLDYKIEYADGGTPAAGDILRAGKSRKYRFRFEFKSTEEEMQQNDSTGSVEIVITEAPSKGVCPEPESFSTDSWDTIACNVKKGNTSAYNLGDTKEITFEYEFVGDTKSEQTVHVRVANKTTPQECSQEGFSQGACGFVVEFVEVIDNQPINSYEYRSTNKGGWKECELRPYINNHLYEALPQDLRDVIIDTYLVSSHGSLDTEDFETTDKIYLFSTTELFGDAINRNQYNYDTATSRTRQLDLYNARGVTLDNNGEIIVNNEITYKYYVNGYAIQWWTRSARNYASYGGDESFVFVNFGSETATPGTSGSGVSPAFRIG